MLKKLEQSDNVFASLLVSLIGFPKYAIEWTVGLVVVVLTDLHITSLAVTGGFIGWAYDSVVIGVAAFFLLYSVSRIVALISNAIGYGLKGLSQANASIGSNVAAVFGQAQESNDKTAKGKKKS